MADTPLWGGGAYKKAWGFKSLWSHQFEKIMKIKFDKKHEEEYIAFLKKRLESQHFKESVSKEEYEKTKMKYDKAKLRLKLLV